MKLLLAVQRYGKEVPGGAESFCRMMATGMVERGHQVEVVTSRAVSYEDWSDVYPPGDTDIDGVTVRRLSVRRPRLERFFSPLEARAVWGYQPSAPALQEAWLRAQGPDLVGMRSLIRQRAPYVDAIAAFTYLYLTTWDTLAAAAGIAPVVVHATAHDEPHLWLTVFDRLLSVPDAFVWSTPEERDLLDRRARRSLPGAVVGIGTDLAALGQPDGFRQHFGLGTSPYLLYTGRIDPAKGADELYDQFVAFCERHPESDLRLVMMGDPILTLADHPSVLITGFVDEGTRVDAVAGCQAMVVPSYYESFSMALTEGWAQGRPALVQGACAVLAGQARRSGGALAYRSFAEFEAAVEMLTERPQLAADLGASGRRYVEANYTWDAVLGRYEALLVYAGQRHRHRVRSQRASLRPRVSSDHG
ncbi:MAG: glycosyltransferase [Actinomycetota bacterium]|nr:glycosyltransferase [Actinomycetota bacterium]